MSTNTEKEAKWTLVIDELETRRAVGIMPHEKEPQRLLVSTRVSAEYPLRPQTLEDCVDYASFYDTVLNVWPGKPHTDLLETLAVELMELIFSHAESINRVWVRIAKPDIFPNARVGGLELMMTREQFYSGG